MNQNLPQLKKGHITRSPRLNITQYMPCISTLHSDRA